MTHTVYSEAQLRSAVNTHILHWLDSERQRPQEA